MVTSGDDQRETQRPDSLHYQWKKPNLSIREVISHEVCACELMMTGELITITDNTINKLWP